MGTCLSLPRSDCIQDCNKGDVWVKGLMLMKNALGKKIWRQRYLLIMVLPAFISLIVFKYIPILGLQIAFKDFSFRKGIWDSPWAGLKHFKQMLQDITIITAIVNTFGISSLKLLFGFPLPIVFALSLNEVMHMKYKRVVQTISYFPHFIAYSVVALMLSMLLAKNGIFNDLLMRIGVLNTPYLFLGEANAFWWVVIATEIWKSMGWNSIIFLAALTSISPALYEAATIDGAGRFKRIWHITLPGIKSTIAILLILNVGSIVNGANFDLSYLLGNSLNADRSEILSTYILRTGIGYGRFSFATAVGLVEAVVAFILVISANTISKLTIKEGLF